MRNNPSRYVDLRGENPGDDDDVVTISTKAYKTEAEYKVAVSPIEVLIFAPYYLDLQSAFGHVAYVIDGAVYTWQLHGWQKYERKEKYFEENSYRSANGYVIDMGAQKNIQIKDLVKHGYDNKGYWELPVLGQYRLRQNNCGEAFSRAINQMGGFKWEAGMSPSDHENYIINNLAPLYKVTVNHYPKKE